MKRTTIFPSRLGKFPLVVCLALGGLAVPSLDRAGLAAQQPTAQQAAPPQTTGPLPATHVVLRGETLWGLAQQLLGDPLLWPEIYRLNTAVIEDPHWIFPGEELRLGPGAEAAGAAGVAVAPAASGAEAAPAGQGDITVSPTAAADTEVAQAPQGPILNPATGPTIFGQQGRAHLSAGTLQLREQHAYRAVREGEYYASGFVLDAGEQLSAGSLLGNAATSSISRLTTTTTAMLYGYVVVVPPPGDALKRGDILLSYDMPRIIPDYGAVVRPTGLLKVTAVGGPGEHATAQVVAVYQTIDGGQSVMRADAYRSAAGVRPTPVPADSGIRGEVIDLRSPHEVVNDQDVLFINKGSGDGVHLGDIFLVSRTSPEQAGVGAVVQNQARILIVHSRPHTATGVIIQVDRPDIRPGSAVRQLYRMPS